MKIPAKACDCHVHIFGPAARFAFAADRVYTPADASIEELLALQRRLGFERVVIVHPSPYGTDNSCTLDALKQLGKRARGVAVIDDRISKEALLEMHELGVRGVRLNLQTAGVDDPDIARKRLQNTASRIASLNWHVQIFTTISVLKAVAADIKHLPVPLVIDHFGSPRSNEDVGYLASPLSTGKIYVKLSAPYRVPIDPGPVARAFIAANPDRCLWGSDWPHPFTRGARNPQEVQPFDPIDDVAALERFHGWVGDEALFRKILVDNPARLYDF